MTMRPEAVKRIRDLATKHGVTVPTNDTRRVLAMTATRIDTFGLEEEVALLSQLLRRDIVTFDEAAELITGRKWPSQV